MQLNIPNLLTLLRVILIPVVVVLFYLPEQWSNILACVVFTLAAITDWLDGYLARKLDQHTAFGAFLDPVADKLMVAVCLGLLIERFDVWWFTLPAVIIICREILISALREWMAELGKRAHVAVSYIGKIKTTLQMIAIGLLLLVPGSIVYQDQPDLLFYLGMAMMFIAAALTMWSMVVYLRAAWPLLVESDN